MYNKFSMGGAWEIDLTVLLSQSFELFIILSPLEFRSSCNIIKI